MVLQIIDVLYIKYESIVMYISNHWMETTRDVYQYYWKKVGDFCMYTPKNKPRKDIWHPKAQTENLITKYTAKARKKDVAKRTKNRLT